MKPEELNSVILNRSDLFLFSVVFEFTGNTTLISSDCEPTQQNVSYITLQTEKCNCMCVCTMCVWIIHFISRFLSVQTN